jgi:uncharacterized damage-inducible protein DinB
MAMLDMLRDLVLHKAYADAALLSAVRQCEGAARDREVLGLLHHIVLANRFWVALIRGEPFHIAAESAVPDTIEALVALYRDTHDREWRWLSESPDLEMRVESPFFPGQSFTAAQGLMQVCLHGVGHRAQCAPRLRALGGTPPSMDYIVWAQSRPVAAWPE